MSLEVHFDRQIDWTTYNGVGWTIELDGVPQAFSLAQTYPDPPYSGIWEVHDVALMPADARVTYDATLGAVTDMLGEPMPSFTAFGQVLPM